MKRTNRLEPHTGLLSAIPRLRRALAVVVHGLWLAVVPSATAAVVSATYNALTDVPVSAASYTATGSTVNFTLNFAPPVGTNLMVVKNTGLGFISGTFGNLAQGQTVTLNYGGVPYDFAANYYGGSGNDLVLQWTTVRPLAWGNNNGGQLGDNSRTQRNIPVAVNMASGVSALSGKTVVAVAAGSEHSAALCADGTAAAWGSNGLGQLGDNSTTTRLVPVTTTPPASGGRFSGLFQGAQGSHTLALVASPPTPAVTTLAATSVTTTGATLNGIVNANNDSSAVTFDYGLTNSYGATVAGALTPITGGSDTAVSAVLTGLAPGATYHFRMSATNAAGTATGSGTTTPSACPSPARPASSCA